MGSSKVITTSAILIGCGVALVLTPSVWQQRNNSDKRIVALWILCWCLGLGSVFKIDEVHLFVGQISKISNIGSLLVHVALIMAVYCLMVLASKTLQLAHSELIILAWSTAIFLLALATLFFLSGMAFLPSDLTRTNVNSMGELVYLNAVYVYEIVVIFRPCALFGRTFVSNRSLEARMHSSALFISLSSALIFSVIKILSRTAIYYSLVRDTALANTMLNITFTTSLIFWPIGFIPSGWIDFARKNIQLYYLRYLYWRISNDCGQSLSIPLPGWMKQVQQASFYTHAIAVFMLDIKWLASKNRLVLNDGRLAEVVANLDENLPQNDFIAQCVAQSQILMRQ